MVLFPPCFLLLNPPLLRLPQGTGKGGYKAEFREFFLGAMEGRRSKKGRLEKVVGIQTLRFFFGKNHRNFISFLNGTYVCQVA